MPAFKGAGDLIERMREVRRLCDATRMDRGDPVRALQAVGPLLEQGSGDIALVRPLAAGLGELWDTLLSVHALALQAAVAASSGAGDRADAPLQSANHGDKLALDSLFSDESGLGDEDNPAQPDD